MLSALAVIALPTAAFAGSIQVDPVKVEITPDRTDTLILSMKF